MSHLNIRQPNIETSWTKTQAFEGQGLKIAKAHLNKSLDAKLVTRLKTLQLEDCNPEIKEQTMMKDTLKVLERLFIDTKPVWLRHKEFFKAH